MITCPVHGTGKIRSGQSKLPGGGMYHYCSTLVGVGQPGANPKGYCAAKVVEIPDAAPVAVPVAPSPAPVPNVQPTGSQAVSDSNVSRGTLACSALEAAARLGAPQGLSMADTILLADGLLHGFLLRASQGLPPDVEGLPF